MAAFEFLGVLYVCERFGSFSLGPSSFVDGINCLLVPKYDDDDESFLDASVWCSINFSINLLGARSKNFSSLSVVPNGSRLRSSYRTR